MGWLFGLAVECGTDEADAQRLARELGPKVAAERTRVFRASDGAVWAVLRPVVDSDDADAVARASAAATEALCQYGGPFRFGLAGVEVDEVRSWSELAEDIADGTVLPGLVLSRDAWQVLGEPPDFAACGTAYLAET
ncbi:MAG: hypothetical protein U1F43_05890 [Myxococcota bacterium]